MILAIEKIKLIKHKSVHSFEISAGRNHRLSFCLEMNHSLCSMKYKFAMVIDYRILFLKDRSEEINQLFITIYKKKKSVSTRENHVYISGI